MYSELIESANDFLMYRKFDECLGFCEQQLKEIKTSPENPSSLLAKEGLCVVGCQAYAELNRWQEVLPFITQLYDGIEDCPAKVVQLSVLLHARMSDLATCSAIANIWLRNANNFSQEEYHRVVEIYLSHVLIAADQWADIPQFLDVCGGLNEDQKEAYVKQVRSLQHKKEQQNIETIEEVEANKTKDDDRASEAQQRLQGFWADLSESPFHTFVKKVCEWVKTHLPLSAVYMVRNVALLAIIMYYILTKMNFDMLSWQQWASIWAAVVHLWKSMFAPYHLASR